MGASDCNSFSPVERWRLGHQPLAATWWDGFSPLPVGKHSPLSLRSFKKIDSNFFLRAFGARIHARAPALISFQERAGRPGGRRGCLLEQSAPGPGPATRSWIASHCCAYRVKLGRKSEDQWNPDLRKLSPAEPMSRWRQDRKDNLKTPRPPWLPLTASLPACGAPSPSRALQTPIPGHPGARPGHRRARCWHFPSG